MIIHTVAFRWKAGATSENQKNALEQLGALKDHIPDILEAHVGANIAAHDQGYSLGATMRFASRDTLAAYMAHPAHQILVGWLGPLVDLVEIDIET